MGAIVYRTPCGLLRLGFYSLETGLLGGLVHEAVAFGAVGLSLWVKLCKILCVKVCPLAVQHQPTRAHDPNGRSFRVL